MSSVIGYIKESYTELAHKVSWPKWPNLVSSTIVVLIASIIIAGIIFLFDSIFNGILQNLIYPLGG